MSKRTCWAAALGGCAGGLSREHIISKSQFNAKTITLEGFPWCEDPKTIGLERLVSKNLCVHHNSSLSDTDAEAMHFFSAIVEGKARIAKVKSGARLKPKEVILDGPLIERWFVKTTINIALQGKNRDSGIFHNDVPRQELVEIAFGRGSFSAPEGLHAVVEVGEKVPPPGGIRFEAMLRNTDEAVVAAAYVFHGHRFWLGGRADDGQ